MNLLSKLQQLKDFFVGNRADNQDLVVIDGWLEEAKRLLLLQSLAEHDGVKYVLEVFQGEIEKINERLKTADSKSLPDYERDRLLDKKDLAQKYLNLFTPVSQRLADLEAQVDQELTR